MKILLIITFFLFISIKSNFQNNDCENKTNIIISYLINHTAIPEGYENINKLGIYSGGGINELGDYDSCKSLPYANYYLINYMIGDGSQGFSIKYGLCYFKECDVKYLNNAKVNLANFLNSKNITFDSEKLTISDPEIDINDIRSSYFFGMIVSTIVLSIILMLNIIQCYFRIAKPDGSKKKSLIYDIEEERRSIRGFLDNEIQSSNQNLVLKNFFSLFDFFSSAKKIIQTQTSNNKSKALNSLKIFDGVRFFSTGWVIYGHVFYVSFFTALKNIFNIPIYGQTLLICILSSAVFAVDVFYFLSGFLFCFSMQKYLNKSISKLKIFGMAIFNRYLRLLTLYLFIIIALTYILPFIEYGPLYSYITTLNKYCPNYFWHNLLYINNLIDYGNESMCAGHSWYLANDMQYFIISLVLFLFLNKGKIQIYLRNLIIIIIFLFSLIYQVIKSLEYGYTYNDFTHTNSKMQTFFNYFYIKPWARVTPYILGIYFCELFLQTNAYKEEREPEENIHIFRRINNYLENNDFICYILFILSLILINFSIWTPYLTNHYELSLSWHSFFITFNKTIFVSGLGIILHLTFLGKLIFIYKILTLNIFTIISRISYGVYLIHMYIVHMMILTYSGIFYMSFNHFTILAIGIYLLSIFFSFILSIILESPIINATKKLSGQKS